jgi:hypothetical protein
MKRAVGVVACAGALFAAADASAIIGMPFTPLSFAGAARRTVRRTAWAGAAVGAAAVGAAAVGSPVVAGAAVAPMTALPYGCAVGLPCGGVVYRPVYQGPTVVYVPY